MLHDTIHSRGKIWWLELCVLEAETSGDFPDALVIGGACVFLVFRWLVAYLSKLIDAICLGAITFFVVVAEATGVGLFAVLA